MKKDNNSAKKSEPKVKRAKSRGPVQRDAKEVLAEVLEKLTGKLDVPAASPKAKENRRGNTVGPNRDRLTVEWIWATAGVSTALLVWREKHCPKDSCGPRKKM